MDTHAFCTKCGTRLRAGAAFCTTCGAATTITSAVSGSAGQELRPADAGPSSGVVSGGRSRSKLGLAVLVVGALGIGLGGVWVVTTSQNEGSVNVDDGEADPLALAVLGDAAPEPVVTGSFDLGDRVEIASGTIGLDGGKVAASGGLLIDVPPGAHSEATGYTVGKQEILGHDFGSGVNPISALYSVDNGGQLAGQPIWVEVPAAVPEGGFAMGFFYDEATGGLEALPLVGVGEGSVVVATTHFSDIFIHGVDPATFAALLAAQAAETTLSTDGPVVIVDTKFRPGVDDWPFDNYGSVLAPSGHCAGQALSAMWYFVERTKAGAPALNDRYDNDGLGPTERQEDDRNAYRIASVIQRDYASKADDRLATFQKFLEKWRLNLGSAGGGAAPAIDSWQYAAFITAMKVTGEPQYVRIGALVPAATTSSSTTSSTVPGSPPKLVYSGHAMVVYGADTRGLWIADPNYHEKFRRVPWDGASLTLGPYYSGANAKELGSRYDSIVLLGKTSLVDWHQVGIRFDQLDLGVAGDDLFASYKLTVSEEQPDGSIAWVELVDGHTTLSENVVISMELIKAGSWRLTHCPGTGEYGCPLLPTDKTIPPNQPIQIPLEPADNAIEIYLEGWFDGWTYLDFARVTVHRGLAMDVTARPPTQEVVAGASAAFTIEVANLGAADLQDVSVAVIPPGGSEENALCLKLIDSIAGVSTYTYDCTVTPPSEPGAYQYSISALSTKANGQFVERTTYTQITVVEAVAPAGDIIGALNNLYQIELGYAGEAHEVPIDASLWQQHLPPSPTPLEVYTVNIAAPVYVGVYETEEDAQSALQSMVDLAAAKVANNTGDGVHWCDWYRSELQRSQFHGGDSFVLTGTTKAVDTDPDEPGVQHFWQPEEGWCAYTEAQVQTHGFGGEKVVEQSGQEIGWVQGRLLVTLQAWGPQTAEVAYAELQAVLTE